jgi:hypothetical protein
VSTLSAIWKPALLRVVWQRLSCLLTEQSIGGASTLLAIILLMELTYSRIGLRNGFLTDRVIVFDTATRSARRLCLLAQQLAHIDRLTGYHSRYNSCSIFITSTLCYLFPVPASLPKDCLQTTVIRSCPINDGSLGGIKRIYRSK